MRKTLSAIGLTTALVLGPVGVAGAQTDTGTQTEANDDDSGKLGLIGLAGLLGLAGLARRDRRDDRTTGYSNTGTTTR